MPLHLQGTDDVPRRHISWNFGLLIVRTSFIVIYTQIF